jgi:hypothetical protein
MDFETIKAWLTQWTEKQTRNCRIKGVVGVALGPIALLAAFSLVYWLLRLFTHNRTYDLGDSTPCFWISLAVLPLLFAGNRLVPRRNLMEERMEDGVDPSFAGRYVARQEVMFYLLIWILFTGPRLFDWAFRSFREISVWKKMDTHSCAAVLWLLLTRPRKVPFEEIQRELDWLDLDGTLEQLKQIPDVLFLKSPPPGLSLTQELREQVKKDLPGMRPLPVKAA